MSHTQTLSSKHLKKVDFFLPVCIQHTDSWQLFKNKCKYMKCILVNSPHMTSELLPHPLTDRSCWQRCTFSLVYFFTANHQIRESFCVGCQLSGSRPSHIHIYNCKLLKQQISDYYFIWITVWVLYSLEVLWVLHCTCTAKCSLVLQTVDMHQTL